MKLIIYILICLSFSVIKTAEINNIDKIKLESDNKKEDIIKANQLNQNEVKPITDSIDQVRRPKSTDKDETKRQEAKIVKTEEEDDAESRKIAECMLAIIFNF